MQNFNNPVPVSPSALTDMLSMSAFGGIEETPIENELDLTGETVSEPSTESLEEETGNADISLELETLTPNQEESTGTGEEKVDYEKVINELHEKGVIVEPYEGFENDELTSETLIKLLEHNSKKHLDESFEGFYEPLTDYTKRLIEFDVNSKGKGVEQYLQTLIEEHNIKNLDVANEYDQEKIIREWYSRKLNFTQPELEEKVKDLKETGLLEKEAKTVKPKLDEEAANIAKLKEEEQRQVKETELKVRDVYNKRVIDTLKTGKIGGITLSREDAGNIYSVLTGEDTIEMNLPNGKKAMMNPLDAHIFFNKYAKEGSLERLALATLLLTNPEKFEKEYSKQLETKVTKKFVEEHKYNNAVKGGKVDTREESKHQNFTEKNKNARWPLKVNKQITN